MFVGRDMARLLQRARVGPWRWVPGGLFGHKPPLDLSALLSSSGPGDEGVNSSFSTSMRLKRGAGGLLGDICRGLGYLSTSMGLFRLILYVVGSI